MEFEQKVIIITGASSGIGEGCALKFAKFGGLLTLVGRNVDNLKRVARKCAEFCNNEPLIVVADISLAENVEKIVDDTIKRYGKIDVLVNNAGILQTGGLMEDISKFDEMVATNIRGPYLLTQKSVPHIIKTKGNIVTVSSIATTITEAHLMGYTMTKAALDAFTRCIAAELGPQGVRVNSVNPGPVYTEIFKRSGISDDGCKKLYESMAQSTPLKIISESDDIANIVTFLASDRARCITGSFHIIDGGIHLGAPVIRIA